jgi:hypothetical protein
LKEKKNSSLSASSPSFFLFGFVVVFGVCECVLVYVGVTVLERFVSDGLVAVMLLVMVDEIVYSVG